MKRLLVLGMAAVLLSGCAEEKPASPSVEETVLLTSFTSLTVAQEYDRFCNGGAITNGRVDEDKTMTLRSNAQLLSIRIGGLQHARHPEKSVDQLAEMLMDGQNKVQAQIRGALTSEGCDGQQGMAASVALQFFSKTAPWIMQDKIDKEIVKRGGVVTPTR